ncbi:GNAT domain-containing protein [Aspergillus coremiiformis]|uniref:GNAT domain-containing protein n=1 Tax=Aspergillus coremiiformis TaxID=138285 RepID=A0A5N6YX81_9EURO|nr:GNAT domain-containing protein [Aspergillus coremiiformis]
MSNPHSETPPIHTARLLLRPFKRTDLPALHHLRTTPEVMRWTRQNRIDTSVEETQTWMERYLPKTDAEEQSNCSYNFVVFRKKESGLEEDDLIGVLGIVNFSASEAPEVGYLFLPTVWGMGYATEALKGYAEAWWELRLGGVSGGSLCAVTDKTNVGSAKVLTKCGWSVVQEGVEEDGVEVLHWVLRRPVEG